MNPNRNAEAHAGPPDPRWYRAALDRWDRVLLAREGVRLLLKGVRKREVRRALGWDGPGAQTGSENQAVWPRVLELGCRTGWLTWLVARQAPVPWTAVDSDADRLALASARATGPTWVRQDPQNLQDALPGAPFDLVIVHPWVANGVPPRQLEAFLRAIRAQVDPAAEPGSEGSPGGEGAAQHGSVLLSLYRPVQLVHRWARLTGGADLGHWAWAWQGAYDADADRVDLQLLAFLPTSTPGRFARIDEVVELYVHPLDSLREAAEAAGLAGADRPVARDGHHALYLLTPDKAVDASGSEGSHQASHQLSPA